MPEIVVGVLQLIVGVDGVGARRPVEIALGRVDIGVGDGGPEIVDVEAVGRERAQIGLDPHRRALAAGDADKPHAGQLRDLLREPRIGQILDLRQGHGGRGERQRQDRRVGGIDLGVDRRRRQVGRQQIPGRVDRRLDLLFGDVEADVQSELQGDDRGAGRTRGRHLVEVRHLAELHFQGRRDRGGHHVGRGAGIEGLHLDGRVIDFGQRRQGQEPEGDHAAEHDRHHQQRGRDRPENERGGGTHAARLRCRRGRARSLAVPAVLLLGLRRVIQRVAGKPDRPGPDWVEPDEWEPDRRAAGRCRPARTAFDRGRMQAAFDRPPAQLASGPAQVPRWAAKPWRRS